MPYKISKGKMKFKDPKSMDTIPKMMGYKKGKSKKAGGKVQPKSSSRLKSVR
jgi:hypothetical protein